MCQNVDEEFHNYNEIGIVKGEMRPAVQLTLKMNSDNILMHFNSGSLLSITSQCQFEKYSDMLN